MNFFLETFGCQMNKNDSELIERSMLDAGFTMAGSVEDADILIVNTCSVRDSAESRALTRMRSRRPYMKKRGGLVVTAGCMAQRTGHELIEKKLADIVIGPYQSPEIGSIIRRYLDSYDGATFLSQNISDFSGRMNPKLTDRSSTHPWHRWITISHGCENFCSYCIVPMVRGKLISFPSSEILDYIRKMISSGAIEITLLGQNVNQYGHDSNDISFASLLAAAAEIEGLKKIHFLTSHPMDFNDDIISVISGHETIAHAVHLPLQSGSDRILKLMNRKYTMSDFYRTVEKVRRIPGGCSVTTDLIVGFPGETVDDFKETLSAVQKIGFDDAFTYAYSERSGTPAATFSETISHEEKMARLDELITLQRPLARERLRERIGTIERVIADGVSKKKKSELVGKTFLNHPVVFPGDENDFGRLLEIQVEGVKGSALHGRKIL